MKSSYKREYIIDGIMVSKESILNIIKILERHFKIEQQDSKSLEIQISKEQLKETSFSLDQKSENIDIDRVSNILEEEKVISVNITYYISNYKLRVNLNLEEGNGRYNNKLSIKGEEGEVNNLYNQITDILNQQEKQFLLYRKGPKFLLGLVLSTFFLGNIIFYIAFKLRDNESYYELIFFAGFIFLPLFLLLRVKIDDLVEKTFPGVEFKFGPKHKKYSKNIRTKIAVITTSILGILGLLVNLMTIFGKR